MPQSKPPLAFLGDTVMKHALLTRVDPATVSRHTPRRNASIAKQGAAFARHLPLQIFAFGSFWKISELLSRALHASGLKESLKNV